jgi:hypothetical protein
MRSPKRWGKRLREFRLRAGFASQVELADRLAEFGLILDVPTLSRYENGRRIPDDRQRHIDLVSCLVKLDGIVTLEEANQWLSLGGRGLLTLEEQIHLFPNEGLGGLINSASERSKHAEDWKQLHKECQAIAVQLVVLRGVVAGDNLKLILFDLELHWRWSCISKIEQFTKLEHVPDGAVKQEFLAASRSRLDELQSEAHKLDIMVNECVKVENLQARMRDLVITLQRLERICGQLLEFLDGKLQKIVIELSRDIEKTKESFMLSKIYVD